MNIKTKTIFALTLTLSLFSFSKLVFAHCPLCTAATGAVVATARWYGVDDLIVGTFFGGFTISTAFWIQRILLKRNKGKDFIPFQLAIITILSLILSIITLHTANLFSSSTFFGVDRLLAGTFIGSSITLIAFGSHELLRKNNGNKNYFPFQAIVLALAFLSIAVFSYYLAGWLV